MKLAATLSKLLTVLRGSGATVHSTAPAAPAPLIVALEPRIVYDASAASIGAAPAMGPHPANIDAHATSATHEDVSAAASTRLSLGFTPAAVASSQSEGGGAQGASATTARHGYMTTPFTAGAADATAARAVRGFTESPAQSADRQVVFINSNVADYQTLTAGLPQGTKVVILDSTKDGLAQIEQYLLQHPGVGAIHLVSHGSDGNVQIGSTWLNEGDLSAYSGELAQIGAAMKPGGDFLIYGCDVAENADGKVLVQQIASITGLNVAASTDATGAAALGGDWSLEYDAGMLHTQVIFSQAVEQQYGALLAVTDETYDSQVGYVTPGGATGVTSFTLDGITYTLDQASEFAVDSTSVNQFGPPPLSTGPGDGVLFGNVQGTSLTSMTMTLANGDKMAVQSFDIDINAPSRVAIEALDGSGNVIASETIDTSTNGGSSVFHINMTTDPFFAGISGVKSLRFVETDGAFLTPTLNNFSYVDLSSPPALTATGGSTSFVEADDVASTPIVVDSGITLSDGDATTAKQGTVSITGNFSSGQDVLAFTNASAASYGDISASYNAGSGVLTLTSASGTATIAQWQNAFRAVTYTDTAVTPSTATRTVSFELTSDAYLSSSNAVTKNVTVTATDQTPIVATSGSTPTYRDGASPVTIDGSITVSDLDNTTQSSGTVSVSGGFHSGDTLAFTNTSAATFGNIAASYNGATGVLTLTSAGATATDAQWQHALSAVTFSSTSTTLGNRTISFATSDGTKTSTAATDTVNVVTPVQITTDSGSAAFVAGDNTASMPVAVDSGLTVTDTAATTLASATVAITGGFQSSQDVLGFTNDGATMGNISGSYNAATGVLTLSSAGASATLAQWQSALQSITYTDTAVTPNNVTRTVSFTAVDGAGNTSATATRTVTVTDTDQTPIVTATGGTTNYVAGAAATTIDGGISVSDLDNTTQSSGTVAITSGFHSGDVLTFVNSNSTTFGNIVGSYNSATGVLTLTSSGATASDAQWSNALSAVTFAASANATPGNRTVSFAVNDGIKTSAVRTDIVDVLGPPTITTDSGSTSFVAGDNVSSTPVAIDPGLTLTDGASPTLASATVSITGGFHSGEDVLGFTNTSATTFGNIAGSYNAATGVLTLTSSGASATLAQWQAALEAVAYTDTAITPNSTTRTISFAATDTGAVTSNTATRTVTVTDTDQTPIVSVVGGTTNYVAGTSAVTIDAAITVSDNDNSTQSVGTVSITTGFHSGDTLTFVNTSSALFGNIVGSYNSATGVLTLTSSGATSSDAQWSRALSAVTFSAGSSTTPGNRTIGFTVSDGTKTSAVASDTVAVLGPPTITTDSGSASFVAGDNATSTPVAIDSGLSVSDGSASTLASATVAITGNFHGGEDVLAFVNASSTTYGNIAASYDAATGVLTLSSAGATATLAQWQAALDSVTYTDTAITPNTATRTVSFTAVDTRAVTSNTATRTVTVADTDQTPVVTATGGATSYVAGASAAIINPSVSVTDLDSPTQSSATVSVAGNFHSGEDMLAFTNGNATTFGNIAATYDSATGVLTLSSAGATATDAQWANALSAVTFSTSGTHFGNRTISFATSDGSKTSAAANTTLVVLDRPHITPGAGSASFVAADNATSTPIAVAPGLTLTDASSATASSASVAITSGFHSGEDVLAFANDNATMGNIAASYDASTGVLTLTSAGGTASLAQWRAALASVTYTDTAVVPDTATRVVSFIVTDGNGTVSAAQTRSVTVADTDQTPLLSVGGSVTFTSLGGHSTPVAVAPQVTITDRDPNATLSSAQVAISGGFDAANDSLAFTGSAATGNIAASYNAATGVLTLTSAGGTASLAQWQAALQSVTFSDAKSGASGSRTVGFTVSDGVKTSAVASNTVTIVRGQTGIVPIFPTPPMVVESPAAAQPPLFTGSDHNGAPDVLDEFDQPLPVGSVPIVPTMTFSDPGAPRNMQPLDRTSVPRFDATALDAAIAVAAGEAPVPLPDISFAIGPNDSFSIEVATLLPPSEAMHGGGSDVTVRLANGRSLPGWIHYDAASGVLRGKLPPAAQDVHIVVQMRDASGHETRREIVLAPHAKHGGAHDKRNQHDRDHRHGQHNHGVTNPSAQAHASHAHGEPSVARPAMALGKLSLDQQFAQARAALHVSHPGGAARRV